MTASRVGADERADVVAAALVGAAALVLYVLTLRPDVGGFEDAPKFQFVGYVLGTAHSPGYPLYVLLTHLFGKLPVGTVAYRVNLFSAVMAAAACAGSFVLARQLGSSRGVATAAALVLAVSLNFWRYAVVAEVYSLAAVLAVWFLVSLIAWSQSGRYGYFFAACAIFAAALGNHLTIVGVVPAATVYAISRDRRVLAARVIGVAAVIVILGLAQYGYVVLRTIQHAPYLDAHASSVQELGEVLTAREFADARFQYTVADLATQRIPTIAREIVEQITLAGALLLVAGLVHAVARRSPDVAVLAGSAAGMTLIVINLNGDDTGFLTPIVAVLCPLVALGMEAVRAALASRGRTMRTIATAAAFVLPLFLLTANFAAANQHDQRDDSRAFRALYVHLPHRAAIVADDYWTGMMLLYLGFTGEVTPNPDAEVVPETPDAVRSALHDGRRVFAFQESAAWLAANGLTFRPVTFRESSLQEWLRDLPRGTTVVAASAGGPLPLHVFPAAVGRSVASSGARRSFETLVWNVGDRTVRFASGPSASDLRLTIGGGWWWRGTTAQHAIQAHAESADGATIREGEAAPIVRVDSGTAIAVFTRDGRLHRVLQFERGAALDVPVDRQLYTFDRATPCADLRTDSASDVTDLLRGGGWLTTESQIGETVAELTIDGDRPVGLRYRVTSGDGDARVEQISPDRFVTAAKRTGARRPVFALSIGAPVRRAVATLKDSGSGAAVRVCQATLPALVGDDVDAAPILPAVDRIFGAGWHEAERAREQEFRWASKRSTLLLPLRSSLPLQLRVTLTPAHGGAASVTATIDGRPLGSCALMPGQANDCAWRIPGDAVHTALNFVTLIADRSVVPAETGPSQDKRDLAFSLSGGEVRIAR